MIKMEQRTYSILGLVLCWILSADAMTAPPDAAVTAPPDVDVQTALPDPQFIQPIDLTFVVDASGSVQDYEPSLWIDQRNMIMRILRKLTISQRQVRVAMVTFATVATLRWNLERYSSLTGVQTGLLSMEFTGGRSSLFKAFRLLQTDVYGGAPGDRRDVRNVAIIFSDGSPTEDVVRTETAAEDARAAGIEMFALGIGPQIRQMTLDYMSSGPDYRYNVTDLSDRLVYSGFIAKLLSGSASEPVPQTKPCDSGPCMNGGSCHNEDPYSWGFSCHCRSKYGGRLCQITNPCEATPCPIDTRLCWRSTSDDRGRFCYDRGYNLINV